MKKSYYMIASAMLLIAADVPVFADIQEAQQTQDAGKAEDIAAPNDFSDVEAEIKAEAKQDDETEESAPDQPPSNAPEDEAVTASQAAIARMAAIINQIAPDATRNGNSWDLTVGDTPLIIVTDVDAGRMRIITPIAALADLPEGALLRLMQANFDTALDARYAIANQLVWGTFIHPLASLTDRDFASGLLQTKTLADTFGTTFTSGALSFGGGDSNAIIEDQLEALLKELEKDNAI